MQIPLIQTLQSAAAATGNGTDFMCEGLSFATFQVTGTFVGTVAFEATIDNSNWVAVQALNEKNGNVSTTASSAGLYSFYVAGFRRVRARISSYTSGNITVTAKGTSLSPGYSARSEDYFSALALGKIPGRAGVDKFGESPGGLQTTATDVWDRADATPTQQIWLAPTAARIHTIASSSANDTTGGTGVNSVKIWYLPDWDTAEASETVTGNLNGGIAMENAAVMIHRKKTIPQATTTSVGGNAGTITATAASDGTVTSAILPNSGQTEMAIYGVPSTQTALLHCWYAQIDKAQGAPASADFQIRVNENPDVQTLAFLRKGDISVQSTGASSKTIDKKIPVPFDGPCIIKIQGIASAADIDGSAGFCLELVTN